MKVLSYGEDGLTVWAIKYQTSTILNQLQDDSAPNDCLAFYRPSCGRGDVSSFGEFDIVLATRRSVYLFECKWDNLAASTNTIVKLKQEQVKRHNIFAWYIVNWSAGYSGDWNRFHQEHSQAFKTQCPSHQIPPAGSLTAQNLEYILSAISSVCAGRDSVPCENVLMYFYRDGESARVDTVRSKETEEILSFRTVNINYAPHLDGNFVELWPS